ncbi:MAG: glycerol-3-phosphate dehydrogenase/oxidase [Chloroflexi bacterium]|nr:MAG: glycerol-3-phosphate dehydrogenase/oxidase [Chloroflexota bacterium]
MQPLSSSARMHSLSLMGSEQFDVLVIGGGVTGAGVALDAVARGYKVALVEKADFASGTSSKSTKLVHGGIRYLPNFDFALVREALVERGLLLQNAPFLVKPVGFVLPIYKGDRHPVGMPFTTPWGIGLGFVLNIGLWLYDGLAGRRNYKRHRHLSRKEVMKLAPGLVTENLKEGLIYYDGQTNDTRLTMAILRTASQYGATIANYAGVTSFVSEKGKVTGAHVRDYLGDQEIVVRARHIVNATGIFSEQVEALTDAGSQVQVEPSKGVHLVFSREDVKLGNDAVVLPETDDKRILFLVPWESRAVFGTTDTGSGDLDHDDIISVYAGYRPLLRSRSSEHATAKLSRTHAVLQNPSGLVTIVGGKLTTYRRMAQDTVDVLSRRDGSSSPPHPTQNLPLFGSAGWPAVQRDLETKGAELGLSSQTIAHLGESYGSLAGELLSLIEEDKSLGKRLIEDLPYIYAEVVYACRHEMAMTLDDVLARRTRILLEDRDRGAGIVDEVAALMARELGWSPEQQKAMSDAYRAELQQQMPVL